MTHPVMSCDVVENFSGLLEIPQQKITLDNGRVIEIIAWRPRVVAGDTVRVTVTGYLCPSENDFQKVYGNGKH